MTEHATHAGVHDRKISEPADNAVEAPPMGPAIALVPVGQVTHRAVASGDWSDPGIWEGGAVPEQGAHVWIPEGVSVIVDTRLAPEIKTLRADGTLAFATDRDTELKVDTLVTTHTGALEIGTAETPVAEDVTARLVFADDGEIDRGWDPGLLSRGALLHGRTDIHGAEKIGFTTLAEQPRAGAESLQLAEIPTGWRVGDEITVAGTDPEDPSGDEVVTITAIEGATVRFEPPLAADHVAPRPDLEVHVANLTRNVEIVSESDGPLNRGHVMFMHTNDVDARYVAFEDLGRSDKGAGLDDWVLDSAAGGSIGVENVELTELDGANVRGRYSVHFHRGGAEGEPGRVEGAVVRDDPGWAYVNHSSNVDFIGNVSHNVVGAAYNTEAGDEVGSFVGNIAIRTVNPEADLNPAGDEIAPEQAPDARIATQDYGFQGDGFWFHGAGVTVEDNVVSGASGHAYIYWTLGLVEEGLGEALVDVATLPNGEMIGPDGTVVRTKHVAVPSFEGNSAYGASKGLQIYYLHTDHRDEQDAEFVEAGLLAPVPQAYEDQLQSTFSGLDFWNIQLSGIDAPYSTRLTFEDVNLLGTGAEASVGLRLDHFANENNFTVRDITIAGFETGLAAPRQGEAVIDGAEISAITDIRINLPDREPRNLEIADITFAPLGPSFDAVLGAAEERDHILMDPGADFGFAGGLFEACDAGDAEGTVAFVGDSITDWEDSFVDRVGEALGPDVEALNFGVAGSGITNAADLRYQNLDVAGEVLESDADLVWIMIGGNDIVLGATVEEYGEALADIVAAAQEMPSNPAIVIAAQPPFFAAPAEEAGGQDPAELHDLFRAEWLPAMQRVAEDTGAIFLDINAAVDDYPANYPDLIHPDAAGAQTLAALIAPEVGEILDDMPARDEEEICGDREDAPDDNAEATEPVEGVAAQLLPDRITFAETGETPVGLYFDEQAPGFVPVPEGSEIAIYLPEALVGLTNAEMQAAFGLSFGGALTPETAMPDSRVSGGLAGPAAAPFSSFPPEIDPLIALRDPYLDEDRDLEDDGPILGTAEDDVIRGLEDADVIRGLGGNDTLLGGLGDDSLVGGAGDDVLIGGDPNALSNADGADAFNGGEGSDTVSYAGSFGSLLVDLLFPRINTFAAAGDSYSSIENLTGSQGADNLRGTYGDNLIQGGRNVDYLFGRQGNDTLDGGVGNDVLFGGPGADVLRGGADIDRAQYSQSLTAIVASLTDASQNTGEAAGDSYDSIEGLAGSAFDDRLTGESGGNQLFGREGNDTLLGLDGDDYLNGGGNNDRLDGGAGNDTLRGGSSRDTFVFNDGADVVEDWFLDFIELDAAALGLAGLSAGQVVTQLGTAVGADFVLDFDNGDTLTLQGQSEISLTQLAGFIEIA